MRAADRAKASPAPTPLERLASFRFAYLAIFLFLLAYVFSVEGLEALLQRHFQAAVSEAVQVDRSSPAPALEVGQRVSALLHHSPWIRWGDVRVRALVLAADGRTLLYATGHALPPEAPEPEDPAGLLPAVVTVDVSVPHNGLLANAVLVLYAAILLCVLVIHTRRLADREQQQLRALSRARDAIATRALGIERELEAIRARLAEVEPEREVFAEEVDNLEHERRQLLARVAEAEARDREQGRRSLLGRELEAERRALEELLEEASGELAEKDAEIARLRSQVRRGAPRGGSGRAQEEMARRLRALYKNLEADERAVQDLVRLGDESLRLRAEEALKRLSDEPEHTIVRRKVGGLPAHLSIFELAFAGRGRIYYTRGRSRRYRLLAVGAKNTQKADLEYLSRLPKEA